MTLPKRPIATCVGPASVERGDAAVLDEHVVERHDDFAVDRRPVVGVGGFDDDVAVQAHVEAVVLADVRVVPVQAGVGEPQPVGELAADRDRRLRLVRHAVVACCRAAGRASGRSLRCRRRCGRARRSRIPAGPAASGPGWNRCTTSMRTRSSPRSLATGAMRSSNVSPSSSVDDLGSASQSSRPVTSVEKVSVVVVAASSCVHDASAVSGSSGRRSSGIGIGANALTLAPPVLPTGYAGQRTGRGDDEPEHLADDLVPVAAPERGGEHRDVGPHVRPGHRLAQDVRAFEVRPLARWCRRSRVRCGRRRSRRPTRRAARCGCRP